MNRILTALCVLCLFGVGRVFAADAYDAAVAHPGRSAADLKRDALDHPAEVLRLAGIKDGMRVADVLAGDGYYSELASYLVIVAPDTRLVDLPHALFDGLHRDLDRCIVDRHESGRRLGVGHQLIVVDRLKRQRCVVLQRAVTAANGVESTEERRDADRVLEIEVPDLVLLRVEIFL